MSIDTYKSETIILVTSMCITCAITLYSFLVHTILTLYYKSEGIFEFHVAQKAARDVVLKSAR